MPGSSPLYFDLKPINGTVSKLHHFSDKQVHVVAYKTIKPVQTILTVIETGLNLQPK